MTLQEFLVRETFTDTITAQDPLMRMLSLAPLHRAESDWGTLTHLLADRLRPHNGVNRAQRIYIMKVLALKYSHRPGYSEDWRP